MAEMDAARGIIGDASRAAVVAVALAIGASGCGGDDDSSVDQQPSAKATVVMTKSTYEPAHLTVQAGSRVTFFNSADDINTAETDGVAFFEVNRDQLDRTETFDTHVLYRGEAESVEFDTPGTYKYHSSLDAGMRGTIKVVAR